MGSTQRDVMRAPCWTPLFESCVLQREAPRCSLYDNRIVTCIHCGRAVLVDRPVLEV